MEANLAAGALLGRVDDTTIEGPRIDVEADGPIVELARVEYAMHGVGGIDGAGIGRVHLFDIFRLEIADAGGQILMDGVKIFNLQAAYGDGHPAVLVAVVMHGAGLADLPADGEQLIDRSFIDQVAGVVLAIPGEIGSEGFGMDRSVLQECAKLLNLVEGRIGQFAEFGDEGVDWGLFDGNRHRGAPVESITHEDGSIPVGREDLTTEGHRGFSRILLRNVSR